MSEQDARMNRLTERLLEFRDERDWKQFHSLKNLILSLNLEAAELLELTQWKSDEQTEEARHDPEFRVRLEEECSDVLLYLLLISERAGIDLLDAASEKITKNALKYPVDKSKGSARKYDEL